jgi:transcriptional regulator with XRE-family HTH domain
MGFEYNTEFTKIIRKDLNMSVDDMVDIIGWSDKTLNKWESGISKPSIAKIAKLSRHYFSKFTQIPLLVDGERVLRLSGEIVPDTEFWYCTQFSKAIQGESSREELAGLLKVSSTAIYAWQQGRLGPSLKRVEDMANLHFSQNEYLLPLISRESRSPSISRERYSPLWLG